MPDLDGSIAEDLGMKAYQLYEPKITTLVDLEVPEPGTGEVLLKVAGAGVCHSDLHIRNTVDWKPIPMTLGHEVCGYVEQTGDGVTGWDPGAAAVVYLAWGCGLCRTCASGVENACEKYRRLTVPGPGLGFSGGMAEYLVVPARFLVSAGDVDPVDAAPLTDAALTPYHAIRLVRDSLTPSATVVVIGVGGLGHMAVQILAATTGTHIVAVDTDAAKLTHAQQLGASDTIVSGKDAAAALLDLTSGRGAQVVLDCVGADTALRLAADVIAPYGAILDLGLAAGTLPFVAAAPPVGIPWGASIVRPYGGTRADLHDVMALAAAGKISVTVERFPLLEADQAFARLGAGQVTGRAVLTPLTDQWVVLGPVEHIGVIGVVIEP